MSFNASPSPSACPDHALHDPPAQPHARGFLFGGAIECGTINVLANLGYASIATANYQSSHWVPLPSTKSSETRHSVPSTVAPQRVLDSTQAQCDELLVPFAFPVHDDLRGAEGTGQDLEVQHSGAPAREGRQCFTAVTHQGPVAFSFKRLLHFQSQRVLGRFPSGYIQRK